MKHLAKLVTIAALLSTATLSAQETGEAAVSASSAARNNTWQNWIFAGGAIVAAAVGITVVVLNTGSSVNSH